MLDKQPACPPANANATTNGPTKPSGKMMGARVQAVAGRQPERQPQPGDPAAGQSPAEARVAAQGVAEPAQEAQPPVALPAAPPTLALAPPPQVCALSDNPSFCVMAYLRPDE